MKKVLLWGVKAIVAGIAAFFLLTLVTTFYCNSPASARSADGETDSRHLSNAFFSRATEGFSIGHTNNDGYMNTFDYTPGMDLDVLILGSSQMEAFQVKMEQSTAGLLNKHFKNNSVYNLGISGHYFETCVSNLEAAAKKYRPKKFIVIGTGWVEFTDDEYNDILNGTVKEKSSENWDVGGIRTLYVHSSLLRRAYSQVKEFMSADGSDEDAGEVLTPSTRELADALYKKIHDTAESVGAKAIILYYPAITIEQDGSLNIRGTAEAVKVAKEVCAKNGVILLDMTERYLNEYEIKHILPYGFVNSSVGAGHLNKYGHAMIADELIKIMEENG